MTELRIRNPLVGWQEIDEADPGDEHDDLGDLFREGPVRRGAEHGTLARTFARAEEGAYDHVGFRTAVPLSVPRPLVVRRSTVDVVCPGRSRAEGHRKGTAATPRRLCVQALVDVPQLDGWPGFYADNGHLPYLVPDLHREAAEGWRVIVREQHDSRRLILATRDTNTHGEGPSIHPDGKTLTRPVDAIDKTVAVPGKGGQRLRLEVLDRRTVNLTIDGHNAQGLLLRLTHPATGNALIYWHVTANIGRKGTQARARANIALVRRGFRRG